MKAKSKKTFSLVIIGLFLIFLIGTLSSCKEDKAAAPAQAPEVTADAEAAPAGLIEENPGGSTISNTGKPYLESVEGIAAGEKNYKMNGCAVCHGDKGLGDGPGGKSLKPAPRDLVAGKWTQGGKSIELFKSISNGVKGTGMAAFKGLPLQKRWELVQYIRSITKNKVADDEDELVAFGESAQ